MRLVRIAILGGMLCAAFAVQAKEREFSPVPQSGQDVRFSDGQAVLMTGNAYGNLAVTYIPLDKKTAFIKLWAENAGESRFNFGDASVTAARASSPIQVLTYADRVKAEKRREMWQAIGAGLAAGLNSYNASQAGYSSSYGSFQSSTRVSAYGSGGYATANASTFGHYSGTTYNGGIAYLAQANAAAQNQAIFDRFAANKQYATLSLQQRALKLNTLMPGQSVLGDVQITLPKPQGSMPAQFTINIDVGGDRIPVTFREGPPVMSDVATVASQAAAAADVSQTYAPNRQIVASESPAPAPTQDGPSTATTAGGNSPHAGASSVDGPSASPQELDHENRVVDAGNLQQAPGRFTGRSEVISAPYASAKKLNCEYDVGKGNTVWREAFGGCPSTWQ